MPHVAYLPWSRYATTYTLVDAKDMSTWLLLSHFLAARPETALYLVNQHTNNLVVHHSWKTHTRTIQLERIP